MAAILEKGGYGNGVSPTVSFSRKSVTFSCKRFHTKTRFESEGQENSEIAY